MPKRTLTLDLISTSGELLPAVVELEIREPPGKRDLDRHVLTIRWSGGAITTVGRDHYFHALCAAREQLTELGLTPRCYGACRSFSLSGMSAQMSAGLVGYLCDINRPRSEAVSVRTFDAGPEMDLVSVAEQKAYKSARIARQNPELHDFLARRARRKPGNDV